MQTDTQQTQINAIRTALNDATEAVDAAYRQEWKKDSLLSRVQDHIDLAQEFLTQFEVSEQ